MCCSICISDSVDGDDVSLVRDTVVDFGGDIVSASPFLAASHSFVMTVVFIEGDLPTRQTGGSGFVKAEGVVQKFVAFLEHLLHDEHFSGSVNPGEIERALVG